MPSRPEYKHQQRKWTHLILPEVLTSQPSILGEGMPGCGKSYLLQQLFKKDTEDEQKGVKLCWTKTAALNVDGQTLDHFFPDTATRGEWVKKACTYDVISCDEDMIIPVPWWSVFLQVKKIKPDIKFRFFGDPMQLHSENYDSGTKLWFNYHNSDLMHFLVDGKKIELQYLEATARYDQDLKCKLDLFHSTQSLTVFGESALFKPLECDFNIVKTPVCRNRVNDEWVAALAPDQTTPCGKLKLWKGMYLISHKNEGLIVNSTRYRVLQLSEMVGLVNEVTGMKIAVSYEMIGRTCKYGYADTVMRVISRTIPGRFNIHECGQMDWNKMFVALSRARTATAIGMTFPRTKKYEFAQPPEKGELLNPKKDLFTGMLYERTDGHNKYIGRTDNMKEREKQHLKNPVNPKVAEWERSGTKIVMTELESYVCSTIGQLQKREYELIAQIPPERCMNKNGVMKTAVEETTTKIDAVEVSYTRFKIIDDVKNLRYRIQWRDEGVPESKAWSYKLKPKADQLKAAEEFRALLVKEYFI